MELSDAACRKAVRAGHAAWVEALPSLVASLAQEWGFRVIRSYPDATEAFVAEVALRRTVEHALSCAASRARAHRDERAVLVHGDVHRWNALQAPGGFKLVDPDGLLAEPEYDLGVLMREDPVELLAGDPADRARGTGPG